MEQIKKDILKSFVPRAVLLPLNEESKYSLSNEKMVPIRKLPFKIGRESRMGKSEKGIFIKLRIISSDTKPNNDLYLIDKYEPLEISKEHCEISLNNEKLFIIKDRNSTNGITVNDESIGGKDQTSEKVLNDGDIIKIGSKNSPYEFQFLIFDI